MSLAGGPRIWYKDTESVSLVGTFEIVKCCQRAAAPPKLQPADSFLLHYSLVLLDLGIQKILATALSRIALIL
jgi:hypothetical protein